MCDHGEHAPQQKVGDNKLEHQQNGHDPRVKDGDKSIDRCKVERSDTRYVTGTEKCTMNKCEEDERSKTVSGDKRSVTALVEYLFVRFDLRFTVHPE